MENHYDQCGCSLLYQRIDALNACEKSGRFYNAKTCNFSTGLLLEGLTHTLNFIFLQCSKAEI